MRENIKYRLSMKPINFKSKQKPAKFTVPGLDEVRRYAGFIKFSKHYFKLKLNKGFFLKPDFECCCNFKTRCFPAFIFIA